MRQPESSAPRPDPSGGRPDPFGRRPDPCGDRPDPSGRRPDLPEADWAGPALLTLWPDGLDGPKSVEPREVPSLREAFGAASAALREGTATPWIITASGLILSPSWLMASLPLA